MKKAKTKRRCEYLSCRDVREILNIHNSSAYRLMLQLSAEGKAEVIKRKHIGLRIKEADFRKAIKEATI